MKKEILMFGDSEHKWYSTGHNGWWSIPLIIREADDPEGLYDDVLGEIRLNVNINGDNIPDKNDLREMIEYSDYNKLSKKYKMDFSETDYNEKIKELIGAADSLLSLYRDQYNQ